MDPHNNDTGRAVSFSQVPQTKPDDKTRQSGNNGKVAVDQAIATPSSASIPGSRPTKGQGAEMEDIREFFDDLGGDSYALAVYFGCLVFLIVSILGFWLLPWSWIVALASVLITFVIVSLGRIYHFIALSNSNNDPSTAITPSSGHSLDYKQADAGWPLTSRETPSLIRANFQQSTSSTSSAQAATRRK
jgi:hypothetical protein